MKRSNWENIKAGDKLVCVTKDVCISKGCEVGDIVIVDSLPACEWKEKGYIFVITPNSPDTPRAIFLSCGEYEFMREISDT